MRQKPDKAKGQKTGQVSWPALAIALEAAGTGAYLAALIDLIGGLASNDRITVTRYIAGQRPEFLTHRNFSDDLVRKYLEVYYPFDPFHAYWSRTQASGVVPLSRFSSRELKQGRYIAEFLAQSVIRDEVGVLLDDGARATLGVFLERASKPFTAHDVARLEAALPALAELHAVHRRLDRSRSPVTGPTKTARRHAVQPAPAVDHLWPSLTARECEVVSLILAGHASPEIARRLGIAPGTVRNHRLNIYAKLDITSEREVFLTYLDLVSGKA